MKRILQLLFWMADKRHRAWKQLELFACDRKMKAVLDMHRLWKRITGEDLKN